MNFDKMMKECMKPHALAHSVSGAGVALIVVSFWPTLAENAMMAGVIVLVVGVLFDFWAQMKA